MRKVVGKGSLGVVGAVVAGSVLAMGGFAMATTQQTPATTDAPAVELAVAGEVKPGNELVVLSPCADGDVHAQFTSSFGVSGQMHPAADAPTLMGFLELPDPLPASDSEPEYVTVTCDSGAQSSVRIDGRNLGGAGSEDLLQVLDK